MIEVQKYSQVTKTLYQIDKEDHAIHIGSIDGNDTLSIPVDILGWVIQELTAHQTDMKYKDMP